MTDVADPPGRPRLMPEPTDGDLVRRHLAGDAEAMLRLLERHRSWLQSWFARRLPRSARRRLSAEDLAQEAWIVVVTRIATFEDRGDASFREWLRRIAELKLHEGLRRHLGTQRRAGGREVSRGARPETENFAGYAPSPSAHAVARELGGTVRRAFDRLPPDSQEVIRLVRVEGLTLDDAAARLGRSREATRKLFERALARFAQLIEHPGEAS